MLGCGALKNSSTLAPSIFQHKKGSSSFSAIFQRLKSQIEFYLSFLADKLA